MKKILPGEELVLGPKHPIVLSGPEVGDDQQRSDDGHCDPMSNNGFGAASLAESLGSSGASGKPHDVDDAETEDDEDGVKCIKCDKVFHDIFT